MIAPSPASVSSSFAKQSRPIRTVEARQRIRRAVILWSASYAVAEIIAVVAAAAATATSWPWVAAVAILEGAVLGVLQGWILDGRNLRRLATWVLATVVGVVVARLIEFTADASPLATSIFDGALPMRIIGGIALGASIGLVIGRFQSFALVATARPRSWWPVICAAAWATALPLLLIVGAALSALTDVPPILGAAGVLGLFGLVGAVAGAIEGIGIALLQTPSSDRS